MYVLFVNSLVMAEIHALESAMEFSMEIGLEHVIFEGDALVNTKEVQATAECWNQYGQTIQDLRASSQGKISWTLRYALRECNQVAHKMAKFALENNEDLVWLDDDPDLIKSVSSL